MPVCFVCSADYLFIRPLLLHLQSCHKFSPSSIFRCREGACLRDFKSVGPFRQHLVRKHHCQFKVNSSTPLPLPDVSSKGFEDLVDNDDDDVPQESPSTPVKLEFYESVNTNALHFVSKLYSKSNLTRNHVQDIVCDTTNFLSSGFLSTLKGEVVTALQNKSTCNIKDIEKKFEILETPFENLSTEYRRLKELEASNFLIRPMEYIISSMLTDRTDRDGNAVFVPADLTGHIIPLRHVLQQFFEMPQVLQSTLDFMSDLSKEKDIISNFIQGSLWKEKVRHFDPKDIVIPLFLYFDDYETCNPLGTSSGIHKLGAAYVTIPTIPLEFQSSLDNIFLVLLFHSSDWQKSERCSWCVFKRLIDEFTHLETEGVTINTNNGQVRVYFVLGLILGDKPI